MERSNPVDVLVAGAGASGIPAAVAAARAGARVRLLDEDPVVGGAAVDMYVAAFCGLPRTGIVKEIEDELKARHGIAAESRWFLPASWQAVYGKLLREAGVEVVLGARAAGALVREAGPRPVVEGVRVERCGQPAEMRARVTIDATGTGAVALAAGCRALYGEDARADFGEEPAPAARTAAVQNVTWMYVSQRIVSGRPPFDMRTLDNPTVLVNGVGWFHNAPERAMELDPGLYLHWGCSVPCEDTRDPLAVGAAQQEAMARMERDLARLREAGYAVHLAPRIGVRESWRVVGEHVITLGDLASGRYPEDKIAEGWYGVDIWTRKMAGEAKARAEIARVPPYGIPYRALVPQGVDGLLVAGKAISGTHIAMSAYRVMPIVGAIGQSAGVAAALCAARGAQPRDLDPQLVRQAVTRPPQNLQLDGWDDGKGR